MIDELSNIYPRITVDTDSKYYSFKANFEFYSSSNAKNEGKEVVSCEIY
jgi:hypothetical protein